jgi:hypothetical protein
MLGILDNFRNGPSNSGVQLNTYVSFRRVGLSLFPSFSPTVAPHERVDESVPSFPRTRESILRVDKVIQVFPVGVALFYQLHLPRSSPLLDLFFSSDCTFRSAMKFKIDQLLDTVLHGKAVQ